MTRRYKSPQQRKLESVGFVYFRENSDVRLVRKCDKVEVTLLNLAKRSDYEQFGVLVQVVVDGNQFANRVSTFDEAARFVVTHVTKDSVARFRAGMDTVFAGYLTISCRESMSL